MNFNNIIILLSLLANKATSSSNAKYKILFHSDFGGRSHAKPILEIGQELINQQHKFIYTAPEHNRKFLTEYNNMSFISMGDTVKLAAPKPPSRPNNTAEVVNRQSQDTVKMMGTIFPKLMSEGYRSSYPKLLQIVKEENPDLIICDMFNPYCRDIAIINQIPLITGLQTTDVFGISDAPYKTSGMDYSPITTEDMSILERFYDQIILKIKYAYYLSPMVTHLNLARREFAVPNLYQPFGNFKQSLAIANTFVGFEAAVPIPPYVKIVGPIKSLNYPKLNTELNEFMSVHNRVLYIAFGSNFMLDYYDIDNLITTILISLENNIIDGAVWGLGKTDPMDFPDSVTINDKVVDTSNLLKNEHPHIRLLSWAPQIAILEHSNTKVFISHGGLESSFEGILSKTPILCMAMAADQPRNARKLEDSGVGKYINSLTIKPKEFSQLIDEFIMDKSGSIKYNLDRMFLLANSESSKITNSVNIILDYIDLAKVCRSNSPPAKFDELPCEMKHMGLAGDKLNYLQANQLDVYGLFLLAFSVILSLVSYLLFRGVKLIITRSRVSEVLVSKKDN